MADEDVYRIVMGTSKQLEKLLEQRFGAQGKGLHSKALSVEAHIGPALLKKIQFLASVRNQLVHEDGFDPEHVPLSEFLNAKQQVLAGLDALEPFEAEPDDASDDDADDDADYESARVVRRRARVRARKQSKNVVGLVLLALAVVVVLSVVAQHADSVKQARIARAAEPTSSSSEAPDAPLWSIEHARHQTQPFPWREEQAAFIAGGEKGKLPNETLWTVMSPVRQLKKGGVTLLELDITLGGGTMAAQARFATADAFGKLGASRVLDEVEIPALHRTLSHGVAVTRESTGHSSNAFTCMREIPGGCSDWRDEGVAYIALSAVSFDNALKVAY